MITNKITPCLWYDKQAEEAANLYVSIFKNSKITSVSRYGKEGFEVHQMPEGTVMTIAFELDGQPFTALNGGPIFKFTEAVSFQVSCETQAEVDHFWEKLIKGGGEESQCGWLKDKFGLSWQIVPTIVPKLMSDPAKAAKMMKVFLQMKKIDIAKLEQAAL